LKNTVTGNEDQIIAAVRSGNARAFAVLCDRYKDRALTLAVRLVGDRGEAEELVQDAFVNAYRNLGQFRGEARFGTWLHRIVYNLCMTKVTRRRERMASLDAVEDGSAEIARDNKTPSIQEMVEEHEMIALVSDEINNLPEPLKAPLLLFYVQELKYEEVAEIMNLPMGTVKTYLHRGRNLLRQRLQAKLRNEVVFS
jgi:RNA polymerase sigma-70 factor (ECF subfamily)